MLIEKLTWVDIFLKKIYILENYLNNRQYFFLIIIYFIFI
jgi:hypothetical protein